MKNISFFIRKNFPFLKVKFSIHRRVFVMKLNNVISNQHKQITNPHSVIINARNVIEIHIA